eukprot:GCRY01003223.1.p1 GENE.GCRY01003223.1~~GCRY01003223.1.p1  ORF type:complete len:305 (-),score=38.41 GCRY01003223.1:50-964(-)
MDKKRKTNFRDNNGSKRKRFCNKSKDSLTGKRGVLFSCDLQKTARSIDEVKEMLELAIADLGSNANQEASSSNVEVSLEQELADLRSGKNSPFRAVRIDTPGLVFLECKDDSVDCTRIVSHILNKVKDSGVTGSRYVMRLVPITACCPAYLDSISRSKPINEALCAVFGDGIKGYEAFEEHKGDKVITDNSAETAEESSAVQEETAVKPNPSSEVPSYGIVFKSRNNYTVTRDQVIDLLARMIGDCGRVCLSNPDFTVVAEVIGGSFAMSVVEDYNALLRYNIRSLSEAVASEEKGPATADKVA